MKFFTLFRASRKPVSGRHSGPHLGSLFALTLMLVLGFSQSTQAQFMLNCPPNMIVAADSANCNATVMYQSPFITGGPVTDTIYAFTGGTQMYIVPANISSITIETWGAQGNSNQLSVDGGLGGYATGDLAVTPGETLMVYVGGGASASSTGGYNGGGNGGTTANCATAAAGGGGGASDVRQGGTALSNRVIVAGGGGGAGGNRVQGCGRGSGGGGGGGYYGGGGGAAWPSSSTVLSGGGTQSAGGAGGTSTYSGAAPQNNGAAGVSGTGGLGGSEIGSNQGGSGTALAGGAGGDTVGLGGAYSVNWTGQSGGGGSGYTGGVTNDSMATGVRTGNGQVRIIASVPFTLTQTAGLPSGSTFMAGPTTNAFTVTQNMNMDSCSFVITVVDSTAPNQNCPAMDSLYLDANCDAVLPNYQTMLNVTDNCDPNPVVTQSPSQGSTVSGANTMVMVSTVAMDGSGNIDSCTFSVTLLDTIAPVVTSCPPAQTFTPTTFDCNPTVNFMPPVFTENCAAAIVSTHVPGDTFPVGTTVVTYTATDSSGNSSVCSFTLTVNNPVVDSQVTAIPLMPCQGATFTLSALPGFTSYMWSTGDTSMNITSTTPGWFWVDLTDGNNCTARDSVLIVAGNPTPMITPMGASLCTGTYATYQWFQNGTMIPGATNQCYMPTTNGSFQVVVTDSMQCQGTSDTLLFVGLRDGFDNPGFDVYPNPAQNLLNVRVAQPVNSAGQILVFDLAGRVVQSRNFDSLQGVVQLNLEQLAEGSYIVEISAEEFRGRRRIVHLR